MAVRSALVGPALLSSSSPKLRSRFSRKPEQVATTGHKKHSLRGVQGQRLNALDPDNATILVAGGGGVALETVKLLKDLGAWTYMLQRTDTRRKTLEDMNVVVVNGDALDKTSLKNAVQKIDGLDAVVSTVGGTPSDPQADSEGNINLIQTALEAKVRRFVLVTSVGVGDSKTSVEDQIYQVLAPVLIEKAKAEAELKKHGSEMEYVIIRPGGLLSEPATDCGVLTDDIDVCGRIHREDVAQLIIKALFTDSTKNKTLHAIDKDKFENRLNPEKPLAIFET